MSRNESPFQKLMQMDMTLPLLWVGLGLCGIGYFYGMGAVLRAVTYGFVGLLAVGMPLLLLCSANAEREQLREIQDQYGGDLRRGLPYFQGPSLRFEHNQRQVIVRLVRRHQRHHPDDMQVELEWLGTPARWVVRPQGMLSSLGRLIGVQDIKLGRPTFDGTFLIQGDNPSQVRRLLSPEVQQRIGDLPEQQNLILRMNPSQLIVRAQHYSLQSGLAKFTEAVLQLYDALKERDDSS